MLKAYSVQMSFKVPDGEKRIAGKASALFGDLSSALQLAANHLNTMYVPFKRYSDYDSQVLVKERVLLRDYRDSVKASFDKIIAMEAQCLRLMTEFASDKDVSDLMNALKANMEDIKTQVNRFLGLFSNIGSPDFIGSVLSAIEFIKQNIGQTRQLLNERIIPHIDSNILAKHWTADMASQEENEANEALYSKLPMVVQLFKERQKQLNQ